jgi:hypothetical protein
MNCDPPASGKMKGECFHCRTVFVLRIKGKTKRYFARCPQCGRLNKFTFFIVKEEQ